MYNMAIKIFLTISLFLCNCLPTLTPGPSPAGRGEKIQMILSFSAKKSVSSIRFPLPLVVELVETWERVRVRVGNYVPVWNFIVLSFFISILFWRLSFNRLLIYVTLSTVTVNKNRIRFYESATG